MLPVHDKIITIFHDPLCPKSGNVGRKPPNPQDWRTCYTLPWRILPRLANPSCYTDSISPCLKTMSSYSPTLILPNFRLTSGTCRLIIRAHSFPLTAEFGLEFVFFSPGKSRGILRFLFEQLFFYRKWPRSSSVTSLFMMIFCLMVMIEWWKWWLMNE